MYSNAHISNVDVDNSAGDILSDQYLSSIPKTLQKKKQEKAHVLLNYTSALSRPDFTNVGVPGKFHQFLFILIN